MTSIIRGNDNFDSADIPTAIQGARAWVNFNGTGTVAIRSSYNTSSITDNGVGDYSVNFTTAFSAADNYTGLTTAGHGTAIHYHALGVMAAAPTASAYRFEVGTSSANADLAYCSAAFFST